VYVFPWAENKFLKRLVKRAALSKTEGSRSGAEGNFDAKFIPTKKGQLPSFQKLAFTINHKPL
jgi:hypothetical protein